MARGSRRSRLRVGTRTTIRSLWSSGGATLPWIVLEAWQPGELPGRWPGQNEIAKGSFGREETSQNADCRLYVVVESGHDRR
eukprot:3647430-Prymnesium_polylepis.1